MNTAVRYSNSHRGTYRYARTANHPTLRQKRRSVAMRKRFLFTAITVVAILLGIVLGNNVLSSSHSSAYSDVQKEVRYTSIKIESGDTLWTIAEEYMCSEYDDVNDYIRDVKQINNLYSDVIHAGAYLMVPYYEVVK